MITTTERLRRNAEILRNVMPEVKKRANIMQNKLYKKGIQLLIVQGFRTAQEQAALWDKGRDNSGNVVNAAQVVTYAPPGSSLHEYGRAIDVVPVIGGKITWNAPDNVWQQIGQAGKEAGFIWGGDWKNFVDRPHFEYRTGYKATTLDPVLITDTAPTKSSFPWWPLIGVSLLFVGIIWIKNKK